MRVYEITLSREAQTLSLSREAVLNLNQCIRVGTDGQTPLPWTAGVRKYRSLVDGGGGGWVNSTRRWRPSTASGPAARYTILLRTGNGTGLRARG